MSERDIVERLEDEAKVFEQTLLDETVDLIREAASEIARLREERRSITTLLGKVETLEADNKRLRAEAAG